PSAYLRTRCAACFGGGGFVNNIESILRPDLIVCIDSHDGMEGASDPPIFSGNTIFLSREFLQEWEAKVETICSAKGPNVGKKRPHPSTSLADEGDRCEDGLHVPNSALQQCGDSFIAADENCIKASHTRFSNTGLMGLLCHHDHVLFLANMWTAGEKQFYALALIDVLMKEIPCHWQVGLLYDIACQLHCALIKWKYLDVWLPRLRFATSVFHAYRHQWVCQLWYHPRKAQIWGLSDGEGCERLWACLRKLIPVLRVTGYHRRLFILDLQIEQRDSEETLSLCKRLRDRINKTQARLGLAKAEFDTLGYSQEYLRGQFEQQQAYQSRPIQKQSKNKGVVIVNRIIQLTNEVETLKDQKGDLVKELKRIYEDDEDSTMTQSLHFDMISALEAKDAAITRLETQIKSKTTELNLGDPTNAVKLEEMKKDDWFSIQLNMCALKDRIISKIRERKFEVANLDRAVRTQAMDHATREHTKKAIKRHSPTVDKLVTQFNRLQKKLISRKKPTPHAVVPPPIDPKGLHRLDVDADIWLDFDIDEDALAKSGGRVPPWLGNENVRKGICFMQEMVNCQEEIARCQQELASMQTWYHEEYIA
ncbi:hypothetical protein BS47DRAFT_1262229, partial [Hydnum rufescens UP504]